MSRLTFQTGDWVVCEVAHYRWTAQVVEPGGEVTAVELDRVKPWLQQQDRGPGTFSRRLTSFYVQRLATPDEIAAACMASPEGAL